MWLLELHLKTSCLHGKLYLHTHRCHFIRLESEEVRSGWFLVINIGHYLGVKNEVGLTLRSHFHVYKKFYISHLYIILTLILILQ